tara:strand:- start:134 stop:1150 length:1017 start_codon:yes stop_codon:yes gene_type:complete
MFKQINSMPAKVCLIISALVSLIYSLNFLLFGDCYVTGGDGCFTILSNDAAEGTQAWGRGAPETGFNGALMFGITLATLLLLNEGAKGMWRMMIPGLIGFTAMTVSIWMHGDFEDASEAPKFVTPIVTALYGAAYFLLKDEGVNDGLSDYKPGIKVQDKFALAALSILVLTGLFYSLRMIFTPDSVISDNFDDIVIPGMANGMGTPSDATVAVSGSLILIYTLWAGLVLTEGASGKWTIMHPSMFAFLTIVIATYVGFVSGLGRGGTDLQKMDAIVGPVVMLLTMLAYFRLKDEGMEDNMTMMGEPIEDSSNMMAKSLPVFALIVGAVIGLNAMLNTW